MGLFVGAGVRLALESLFLAVDPFAKRPIPVEGFVGVGYACSAACTRAALAGWVPDLPSRALGMLNDTLFNKRARWRRSETPTCRNISVR